MTGAPKFKMGHMMLTKTLSGGSWSSIGWNLLRPNYIPNFKSLAPLLHLLWR